MNLEHQSRILVCEDDRDIAALLGIMLSQQGYAVDLAFSAGQAKQLLEHTQYAAMTLDITLPDQDGISLMHELRLQEATRDMPVVVVTAEAEASKYELNGEVLLIVDWLEKPIDHHRLIMAVQQATQSDLGRKPRILHVEDDPDFRRIVAMILGNDANIVTATSLHDARQKLEHEHFDLILLDLQLPDGPGLDLLPASDLQTPSCPVVVFSVHDAKPTTRQGVDATLVKSHMSNQMLLDTIKTVIQRNRHPA